MADAAGVILRGLAATPVGVFVDAGEDALLHSAERAGLEVLQLHGDEPPELASRLRAAGYTVWKAVRARTAGDFSAAVRVYAGAVDGLLLDGWSAAAHGGTGTRFPWAAVAARRGELPAGVSLIAAGGLTPGNVAGAVRLLRPHAVDVSSGVERSPGVKDLAEVRRFAAALRAEDADFRPT